MAAGGEVADGEDVPGVFVDDVGDQEVDLFRGVAVLGGAAAEMSGGDVIGAVEIASGRLYLNAPEAAGATSSGVEDEIVGFAVAVGLGGESEGNGFVVEYDFDQFSIAFGVTDGACEGPGGLSHKKRAHEYRAPWFSL